MGIAASAPRARMPEKAACDWQAFTGEDRVGGVGVAQVVEPDIAWQACAASDGFPEAVN